MTLAETSALSSDTTRSISCKSHSSSNRTNQKKAATASVIAVFVSSSWYKDGEQIVASVPGYIVLKGRDLRIVANEFNEGVYTCRVHRGGNVVSANSWAIHLKPLQPINS